MEVGRVWFLPSDCEPATVSGETAVVIDLLRATTTICFALAAGAREVRPCLEIDEARRLAKRLGRERCLLGGERRGVRIDGFDLGNSPAEYTRERVAGKSLAFTTTNGTRAISRCMSAERVLVASLVNLSAVQLAVLARPGTIDIVCAGTDGAVTREDVLTAGAIVDELIRRDSIGLWSWNDEALIAGDAWRNIALMEPPKRALLAALRQSAGGRNLAALGYDADIETAAEVDMLGVVPVVTRDELGMVIRA